MSSEKTKNKAEKFLSDQKATQEDTQKFAELTPSATDDDFVHFAGLKKYYRAIIIMGRLAGVSLENIKQTITWKGI